MSSVFDIDKFNILEDEEHYYFFRALNMADNQDIEEGNTVDSNGRIERIRTDRERYEGNTKYQKEDELSLEQVFDHIKMHYRKDTNCISLSSNANVSISYGRGYYKDRYAMIKVSKKEFGQKVINAGQYMIEEIERKVNEYISSHELEDGILEILNQIDEAKDKEELEDTLKRRYESKDSLDESKARMRKGIVYKSPIARISSYRALSPEQALERNRIIAKLTLLERKCKMSPIILGLSSNSLLVQTIGNAFSSLEQIHYGEIDKEDIIEVPKEEMDIIALIQQVEGLNEKVIKDLKQEVVEYILSGKALDISEDSVLRKEYRLKENISIDEMYELTEGKVEYGQSNEIVRNMFYISKAQLKAREFAGLLNQIVGNNPKYMEVIEYIKANGFSIEPEIITRQSNKGVKISESVSLDIKDEEIELKDRISKLEDAEQIQILEDGGLNSVRNIMQDTFSKRGKEEKIPKEEYYAEAMFSLYDWKKLGIEEFTIEEKANLINRIKEKYVVELYEKLEKVGIDRENIPQILMNIITRDNTLK